MLKNGIRRGQILETVLGCIESAGLTSLASLSPNATAVLLQMGYRRNYSLNRYLQNVISRLDTHGMIIFVNKGNKKFIKITDKGIKYLAVQKGRFEKINKKKKWDGKWRVVIFDIKEQNRKKRDMLRQNLVETGFLKLQNSVWITPYECEDFIFLLKTNLELGRNVIFMTVNKIEDDNHLKKKFGVKTDFWF